MVFHNDGTMETVRLNLSSFFVVFRVGPLASGRIQEEFSPAERSRMPGQLLHILCAQGKTRY